MIDLETEDNSMRAPRVAKVVVNITTGRSGEVLEKASTILKDLTSQQPCQRRAKRTLRAFGIRKGEPIAVLVTLRGGKADEFLRRALSAVSGRIRERSFDDHGNVAFGIREHIDIPGTRYDPVLGIFGMNVDINIERPGYRVSRRRKRSSQVGGSHMLTKGEAIDFVRGKFGAEVVSGVE